VSVSEYLDSSVDGMMVRRRLVLPGWERGGYRGVSRLAGCFFGSRVFGLPLCLDRRLFFSLSLPGWTSWAGIMDKGLCLVYGWGLPEGYYLWLGRAGERGRVGEERKKAW